MYSGGSKMGHYHKIHIKFYIQLSMFPTRGGVGWEGEWQGIYPRGVRWFLEYLSMIPSNGSNL